MKNRRITVIGPGRMGLGIALSFAMGGFQVGVIDAKNRTSEEYESVLKNAKEDLYSKIKFLRKINYIRGSQKEIISKISFSYGLNEEDLECDVIFEAIPEKPDIKIELFERISPYVGKETILASTTSTINIGKLKEGFTNPSKLLITHWLNPAFIIPLVEIAVSNETDPNSIDYMKNLLADIGKIPVVLKDSPGFIISRLLAVSMNESFRILEEGVATAEDIDIAIKTGFGFRLCAFGLLEFLDMAGLETLYYADRFLFPLLKGERFEVPKLVEEKMRKGETGTRTGKGTYEWKDSDVKGLFEKKYEALVKILGPMKKTVFSSH
jgi:3-hydroxybutyryl-CoA dehydrogenase